MSFSATPNNTPLNRGENIDLIPLLAPSLQELWNKFPNLPNWTTDAEGLLQPLYPRYAQLERVVVLGLNPSYTAKHRKDASYEAGEPGNGYFRNIAKFMNQAAHKYEKLFQLSSQEPLKPFYHFNGLEWSHLDLLYVRTTSQQALTKQLWATPEAAGFTWEQLQITKALLAQLQPTMLILANKLGQTLTGFHRKFDKNKNVEVNEWMGLQFEPTPNEFGAYRITGSTGSTTAGVPDNNQVSRLIGTPVFFTSSFAGTNRRSIEADRGLAERIAAAYLQEGDRYFEQWRL